MVDLFCTIILIFYKKPKTKQPALRDMLRHFHGLYSHTNQRAWIRSVVVKKCCSHRIVFSHVNAGSVTSLYTNGAFVPLIRQLLNRCTVLLKVLARQLICFYRRCQARNGCHIQFGRQGSGSYHCWWGMDKVRYFLKLLCEMCKLSLPKCQK